MSAIAVELVGAGRSQLGENPRWDAEAGVLRHVDITAGAWHAVTPVGGHRSTIALADAETGFAVPRRGGGIVFGADRRVVARDPDGTQRTLAEVESAHPENRFNDGQCDARGRLWSGTMSRRRTPGLAALYRLDPDGAVTVALDRLTLANGLGWSPDGATMYVIDSTTQQVDAFDFDVAEGTLSGRRLLCAIDPAHGLPDGLVVDAEGGVWVALFGGGAIRRYESGGALAEVVELPVTNPTSMAFGGDALDELYVTSARHRLTPEQLADEPGAGALLRLRPGVAGRLPEPFAG